LSKCSLNPDSQRTSAETEEAYQHTYDQCTLSRFANIKSINQIKQIIESEIRQKRKAEDSEDSIAKSNWKLNHST